MEIKYNVTGAKRRMLADAIAEYYGVKVKYMGVPSMAYMIMMDDAEGENPVIDKEGTLIAPFIPEDGLIRSLELDGFRAADSPIQSVDPDENTDAMERRESAAMGVSLPGDFLTDEQYANLEKLVEQKKTLLTKATGFIGLERDSEKISFEFETIEDAYTKLASKMAMLAKTQTRISNKEKPIVNEKYEFRCFLLRLGFIGDEWKEDRKVLLQNLSGSAAFKRKES